MKILILFVTSTFVVATKGYLSSDLLTLVEVVEDLENCTKAEDFKCPRADITFWLYTRLKEYGIKLNITSLAMAPWSAGPLKFLVHGHNRNKDTDLNRVLRPEYFDHGDYNVISVDWSALTKGGCYLQSVRNIPTVAKCVADFFNAVTRAHKFCNVHLLGHSLGAHVAALASERIPNLPRLTKFDPADPLIPPTISRKGQAHFIDVYHSNAGVLGQTFPSGDVDVYFNNGVFQPGCACDITCSHLRCVDYYGASISQLLKAFPCAGWKDYTTGKCPVPTPRDLVAVGENIQAKRGIYLVFTNAQAPFIIKDTEYLNPDSFFSYRIKDDINCNSTIVKILTEL